MSEYGLPADATGPFVLSGYSGYKQVQVPRGRLFAFDSEGNYMLTCSATGGVIYKVQGAVAVGREFFPGVWAGLSRLSVEKPPTEDGWCLWPRGCRPGKGASPQLWSGDRACSSFSLICFHFTRFWPFSAFVPWE